MSGFAPRRWIWIRHAPVKDAPPLLGWRDLEADLSDHRGLAAVRARLSAVEDAVWLSSDLSRAARTAEALGAPARLERVSALREQHFGAWEGAAAPEAFWRDPARTRPPGGESFAELCARVATFIAARNAAAVGPFIVVAHAGVVRAAAAVALDLPPAVALRLSVDPLALTRLSWFGPADARGLGGGWAVEALNVAP